MGASNGRTQLSSNYIKKLLKYTFGVGQVNYFY